MTQQHRSRLTRDHVVDVLHEFDTAFLMTMTPEGVLRGRPMEIAGSEDDGTIWFVTRVQSGKVDDIETIDHAAVLCQSKRVYLNLSGEAQVVDDPERLRSLWQESWRAWFPEGPDDTSLVLLRMTPRSADLWDLRGTSVFRQVIDTVRGLFRLGLSHSPAHQHTAM